MKGEVRRGAVRIVANYARLLSTFVLGIILVPILIRFLGVDAFGLWGLIGATIGLADLFRETVRSSMIRELGTAYHDPDPARFPVIYNSAVALSILLALLAACVFTGVWFLLPYLNIPAHLSTAARWVVVSQGAYSIMCVLTAPQFNMFVVTERMVWANAWQAADRATHLAAALVIFYPFAVRDPGLGLTLFATVSAGMAIVLHVVAIVIMAGFEPRIVPRPGQASREGARSILSTAGWNAVVVVATNLHIRIDQLLMNLFFGSFANGIFTVAIRLTSYVRMLTGGMTDGLDAVSTRISTREEGGGVNALNRHSTRLHAFVGLPAGLLVVLLADPIIRLWVGKRLPDPAADIPLAVNLVRILAIGITARAIADGWMRILYGAGHVRRYAPLLLGAGLLNPLVVIALVYLLPPRDAGWFVSDFDSPALSYAIVISVAYMGALPIIAARCLKTRWVNMLRPLLRPALATALASPVYLLALGFIGQWTLAHLFGVMGAYGAVYALLSWWIVLARDERARVVQLVRRRAGKGRGHRSDRRVEDPASISEEPAEGE